MSHCQSTVANPFLFSESPAVKNPPLCSSGSERGAPEPSGPVSKRWLRGRARSERLELPGSPSERGKAAAFEPRVGGVFVPRRHRGTRRGEVKASIRRWKKMVVIIVLELCEKYLWKVKPKAFPGDGIEWDALENGYSEASSSVQHTQMQTHVVLVVEDGFNELHRTTHTHTRTQSTAFFLYHQRSAWWNLSNQTNGLKPELAVS